MNAAMQAALEGIIRAALGKEGPDMLKTTLMGMKTAFDAVAANQATILEQNKTIMIAQENILDKIGRINVALRIPAASEEANPAAPLQ